MTAPSGVLLVHGAFHTGACWNEVAERLRKRGVPVAVAELHRGSLADDVAAATEALSTLADQGPAVACGSSYGGTVISGLPPAQLTHLIYVGAIMPETGETTLGLMASGEPTQLFDALQWDKAHTTARVDPTRAFDIFYHQSDPARQTDYLAATVAQMMTAGDEQLSSIAWQSVPSTYIVCADDHALHPNLQRRMAQRATHTIEWPCDHSPFLTRPDDLAQLLYDRATKAHQQQ